MEHPVSGGAYAYGRAEVSGAVGFAAGWMFLTGKTASAAAIAVIAGTYAWPEHARWVAVAAIVVFAALNMLGVRVTAWTSAAIVGVVVLVVLAVLAWVLLGGAAVEVGWFAYSPLAEQLIVPGHEGGDFGSVGGTLDVTASPYSVLQAAGLLFFAFAGYARMATLGEEVLQPRRTLPIAIQLFQGQNATQWGLVFAASVIAVIPVIVVYLVFQRHFVQGLTSGAVKG